MELVSDISLVKWSIAVVALIFCMGALSILAKRFSMQGRSMMGNRRMQLVETMHIDPRHKVCMFRHDDMEHVVLIGPQGTTHLDAHVVGNAPETEKDLGIGFLKNHSENEEDTEKND